MEGKKVLITGGYSGIGKACAEKFQEAGAEVLVTDIQGFSADLPYQSTQMDVTKPEDWERVIQEFKPGVLVNNAGIPVGSTTGPQDPESCSLDDWQQVMQVNAEGVFLGCRYGIRAMKDTGGTIVNVASIAGRIGTPYACPYAASKAAVINHTKTVALYCGSKGYDIRCNVVMPGPIETPIWGDMLKSFSTLKEAEKALCRGVPQERFGQPAEVASLVYFLASPASSYCNGSEFLVDGGHMAGFYVSSRL